jgi:hypothetical protein
MAAWRERAVGPPRTTPHQFHPSFGPRVWDHARRQIAETALAAERTSRALRIAILNLSAHVRSVPNTVFFFAMMYVV